MKFLIVTPRQRSGGAIVLHKLCKCLQEQGHDAAVFYVCRYCFIDTKTVFSWMICLSYNLVDFLAKQVYLISRYITGGKKALLAQYYYEPVKGVNRKWLPFVDEETIVVYPEVVFGNPLNAKKLVRWFLFHYKYKDKPGAYNKDDFFICYREIFNDYDLNPQEYMVGLAHFDSELYRQTNTGERLGCCYIVRKGKNRADLPKKWDGEIIDDYPEEKKVEILNRVKYCYLYDTQSFYAQIAAVCGAIPVVMLEPGKKREDYLGSGEARPGIAYGETAEEIAYALESRKQCIDDLEGINKWAEGQTAHFVDLCKMRFRSE